MPDIRLAWKATDHTLFWAAISRALRSPTPVDDNLREYIGPIDYLSGSRVRKSPAAFSCKCRCGSKKPG
ncbi:MAG: hypothetical protein B7Z80_00740 [Rhodospirillales bacterium 20-64-7]|nr:MAG: hypothetical protein B7Z80_00740 [Rhodospirillales bacterium 20-64-7]